MEGVLLVWVFLFLHLHLPSHWAKLWGLQVLCFALLLLSIKFKHEEEMFPHFYFFYFKFELHQNIICGTIKKSRIGLEEAIKNTNIKNNLIFEISFGSLKAICFASVGETIENYCVFRLPHIPHSIQEELKEYYWDQFQITFKQSIGLQSHKYKMWYCHQNCIDYVLQPSLTCHFSPKMNPNIH